MKTKLLFVLLFAFLLSGCAASQAQLAQLPDEGRVLVEIVVSAGVTWLLLQLFKATGWNLLGYANALAAVLAPIFVKLIDGSLQTIPAQFDGIVLAVIHYLVLLVGGVGTFWLVQRKTTPSLRG